MNEQQSVSRLTHGWRDSPSLGPMDRSSVQHAYSLTQIETNQPRQSAIGLSIVMPLCDEEDNVGKLYERVCEVASGTADSCELIFVDDGSKDSSFAILHKLHLQDPDVKVIRLARNFGHQVAVSAGLEFSSGRAVVVMDSDLQDPPEFIAQLYAKWREGYDVVYAIRTARKENPIKRVSYALFYRLLRQVTDFDIPLDSGDFCLMDRRVVNILCTMPEQNRFMRGIRSWVGFQQVGLEYERDARYAGRSKYGFWKLLKLALDGLLGFSILPLRVASVLGIMAAGCSLLLLLNYLVRSILIGRIQPAGFATQVVLILFFGGIQLMFLGIVGEYVGRVLDEVRHRPHYVVWQELGFDKSPTASHGVDTCAF